MKSKKSKVLSIAIVLMLVLSLLAGCGGEPAGEEVKEKIMITIGGGHVLDAMEYTKAASEFFCVNVAERVAAETNYEIEWIEAYGGSIATVTEGLSACETGLVDILVNTYSFETAKLFPMVMSYYVPFATDDLMITTNSMHSVLDAYPAEYEALWAGYNQKLLAIAPTPSYELITTFPVESMADLQGKKIAAAGANMAWLKGTGAVAVQSNLNEAYTSMQTGVYNGWIMHASACEGYKLYEVAPYFTRVGFGAIPIQGISVNLDFFNELPAEVASIIEEEAVEYEVYYADKQQAADQEAMDSMGSQGATVSVLSAEDKKLWANGLDNLAQAFADEATSMGYDGAGIVNTYVKTLKDNGVTLYRDWEAK